MIHSQSMLFSYVCGCCGDVNSPEGSVRRPPQPGIPFGNQKRIKICNNYYFVIFGSFHFSYVPDPFHGHVNFSGPFDPVFCGNWI